MPEHIRITRNRREFLCDAFCGFGALAFGAMLQQQDLRAAAAAGLNPLAAKPPHMPDKAKAKSVVFLFMSGRHGDMVVHSAAQYQLFTGRVIPGFPSMGSWTIYGLGSESDSLPAYVVLPDPHGAQEAGQPMYSNGFLPAVYQPTMFRPGPKPVLNLDLPAGVSMNQRRKTLDLIRGLNQAEMARGTTQLAARTNPY